MKKITIVMIAVFALILQGCSTKADETENNITPTLAVEVTKGAEDITVPATTAPTEEPEASSLPIVGNDTGKVLIQTISNSSMYPYISYVITSTGGESIVVDPTEMPLISQIDLNPAAIIETHNHTDHTDPVYESSYPNAKILKYEASELQTKDFHITGILSSHNDDTISNSNVIMLIEVDGLRIAHMGDCGQTKLTKEQLKALGKIDIAFMQFDNSFSDMTLKNEKGFKLIEQLKPTIVIPTHYYPILANSTLEQKYGTITELKNVMEITKDTLPEGSLNVYEITNEHYYD